MKKAELERARKLIRGMTIPSRPTVMLEVLKAQNAFAPDLQKVADIIKRDVVLSSSILQEANTTLPGLKRKIASIEQAVMLLGLPAVRQVVSSQFLSSALVGKESIFQKLRNRCAGTAQLLAHLARVLPQHARAFQSGYLPTIPDDEAYALGLFHDCGLTMMMQKFADYQEVYDEANSGEVLLVEAESERYRTNHCLAGYLLCEKWQLPPEICEAIRTHHHHVNFNKPGKRARERKVVTLQGILALAEHLSGEMPEGEWRQLKDRLLMFFGLEENRLAELVPPSGDAAPVAG